SSPAHMPAAESKLIKPCRAYANAMACPTPRRRANSCSYVLIDIDVDSVVLMKRLTSDQLVFEADIVVDPGEFAERDVAGSGNKHVCLEQHARANRLHGETVIELAELHTQRPRHLDQDKPEGIEAGLQPKPASVLE